MSLDTMPCRIALSLLAALLLPFHAASGGEPGADKPTVVLVHGAFADASSWNGVIARLQTDGYNVIAAANPLRGLAGDSTYISTLVKSIPGPVVLVGHSYGGAVISNAAAGNENVAALVFVAGFAPDVGESAFGLVGKFPGSILNDAVSPVTLGDGGHDLYVRQGGFRAPVAADLPEAQVRLAAATQRPLAESAGNDPSGEPAWKSLPSWFIYGSSDMSIPPDAHAFMAERAHSRGTTVVHGASHVVMLSHPAEVAKVIQDAARAASRQLAAHVGP